jgi:hypothetical protein
MTTITYQQARDAIASWAEDYFTQSATSAPAVQVLSLAYDEQEDEWTAELEISSSAENPTVTFWIDDQRKLHVENIEY